MPIGARSRDGLARDGMALGDDGIRTPLLSRTSSGSSVAKAVQKPLTLLPLVGIIFFEVGAQAAGGTSQLGRQLGSRSLGRRATLGGPGGALPALAGLEGGLGGEER